jgi:hypothetical protein
MPASSQHFLRRNNLKAADPSQQVQDCRSRRTRPLGKANLDALMAGGEVPDFAATLAADWLTLSCALDSQAKHRRYGIDVVDESARREWRRT